MVRALVLGGGGVTGIAWEIGVILGLRDKGVDVREADRCVGTSAGSIVGSLMFTGADLEAYYERYLHPTGDEQATPFGARNVAALLLPKLLRGAPDEVARRVARRSRSIPGDGADQQRAFAEVRDLVEWPAIDMRITAVDVDSGVRRLFTAADGVPIGRAIMASSAVPTVWPPVTIQNRRYMDGGAVTTTNADAARPADRVVVIAPILPRRFFGHSVEEEIAKLGASVRAHVMTFDSRTNAAVGQYILDPLRAPAAAVGGRIQGRAVADEVRSVWE